MNYESATDFELNKRMGELLANTAFDFSLVTWKRSEDMHGEDGGAEMWLPAAGGGIYRDRTFSYTSDWNATMPLAVEYGLDIELPTEILGGIGQITKYIEGDTDIMVDFAIGDNPLRAIVICLIKALEAQQ